MRGSGVGWDTYHRRRQWATAPVWYPRTPRDTDYNDSKEWRAPPGWGKQRASLTAGRAHTHSVVITPLWYHPAPVIETYLGPRGCPCQYVIDSTPSPDDTRTRHNKITRLHQHQITPKKKNELLGNLIFNQWHLVYTHLHCLNIEINSDGKIIKRKTKKIINKIS